MYYYIEFYYQDRRKNVSKGDEKRTKELFLKMRCFIALAPSCNKRMNAQSIKPEFHVVSDFNRKPNCCSLMLLRTSTIISNSPPTRSFLFFFSANTYDLLLPASFLVDIWYDSCKTVTRKTIFCGLTRNSIIVRNIN